MFSAAAKHDGSDFLVILLMLCQANLLGCSLALLLNILYHKRRLEKIRLQRYGHVPTIADDLEMQASAAEEEEEGEEDVSKSTP